MTIFEKLKAAMEKAQSEQDLPDDLARDILTILQRQEDFSERESELNDLAEKVALYDTYGQTGYLGMGVNNTILQRAIDKLLKP